MRRFASLAAVVLASTWAVAQERPATPTAAPPAASGAPAPAESGAKPDAPPARPMGGYSWRDTPRRGKARPRRAPDAPLLSFPTFQVLSDRRSRITVRMSRAANVQERRAGARAAFVVVGAEPMDRASTLPFDTTHFDTAVSRFRLAADKVGTQLVLELREDVAVQQRTLQDRRGHLLVIEVAAPTPRPAQAVEEPAGRPEATPRIRRARAGRNL